MSQLLSKVTHKLQFLHQLFNVTVFAAGDALVKCVVTEVVLLTVIAFKTFHKVV